MIHKLEVDSIQLEFDRRKILSDIYLKCETGKITGLLGRNGQGKTCLMQIIHGSLQCEKSVRFDNTAQLEVYKHPELLLYLPQFNFVPSYLSLKKVFADYSINYRDFTSLFPEFDGRKNHRISELSGGEHRLVELYIIVKSETKFVMLDEPFTHLNPLQVEKVKKLLIEEKQNKGLLITDHMYQHVIEICNPIYVLADGKTHLTKTVNDIIDLGYIRK